MIQHTLPLTGGAHAGPLFVPRLKRPPTRPKGKEGIVHRAQTKRCTPPWVDLREIEKIYEEARRLTRLTGELHVVDHVVPKIHPLVCGLHVVWNLQVLHWRANALKGNWTWPGMPNEQLILPGVCDG